MTQDRRITDKLPAQPLDWSDTSSTLIAAALVHLDAERIEGCFLPVPDTNPALHVAAGPAAWIAKHAASQSQAVPSELASDWPTHADLLAEDLEKIAETWTGCMYEGKWGRVDIGADLRAAFAKLKLADRSLSHSAATGKVPDDERAAFEHAERASDLARDEIDSDIYANPCVQSAWEGWSARAALASPAAPLAGKAEPVAWMAAVENGFTFTDEAPEQNPDANGWHWTPLYAAPVAQQSEAGGKILAWAHEDGRVVGASTMDAARRDGGAMRSSLSDYTIPLGRVSEAGAPADTLSEFAGTLTASQKPLDSDIATILHENIDKLYSDDRASTEAGRESAAPVAEQDALDDEQLRETDGYKLGWMEGMQEGAELAAGGEKTAADVEAEFAALLPGAYYMDPPDGGSVEVLEQVRRMAGDAARYRWLMRQVPSNIADIFEGGTISDVDQLIDEEIEAQKGAQHG
ncbi:MAG: hypothetical protein ACRYGO_07490 [Janthinobacterium lividum]